MSLSNYLESLQSKHNKLDQEIKNSQTKHISDEELSKLKKLKLYFKDRIGRMLNLKK